MPKLKGSPLRDSGGFVIWTLDKLKRNRIMLGFDMVKLPTMLILVIIQRYFNNSHAKHCYASPVTPDTTYLLRASFFNETGFGNETCKDCFFFHLSLDGTIVVIHDIARKQCDVQRRYT